MDFVSPLPQEWPAWAKDEVEALRATATARLDDCAIHWDGDMEREILGAYLRGVMDVARRARAEMRIHRTKTAGNA
jgi:hypothetical protein